MVSWTKLNEMEWNRIESKLGDDGNERDEVKQKQSTKTHKNTNTTHIHCSNL